MNNNLWYKLIEQDINVTDKQNELWEAKQLINGTWIDILNALTDDQGYLPEYIVVAWDMDNYLISIDVDNGKLISITPIPVINELDQKKEKGAG